MSLMLYLREKNIRNSWYVGFEWSRNQEIIDRDSNHDTDK